MIVTVHSRRVHHASDIIHFVYFCLSILFEKLLSGLFVCYRNIVKQSLHNIKIQNTYWVAIALCINTLGKSKCNQLCRQVLHGRGTFGFTTIGVFPYGIQLRRYPIQKPPRFASLIECFFRYYYCCCEVGLKMLEQPIERPLAVVSHLEDSFTEYVHSKYQYHRYLMW